VRGEKLERDGGSFFAEGREQVNRGERFKKGMKILFLIKGRG